MFSVGDLEVNVRKWSNYLGVQVVLGFMLGNLLYVNKYILGSYIVQILFFFGLFFFKNKVYCYRICYFIIKIIRDCYKNM